jgi:signal transduction histidine kinase
MSFDADNFVSPDPFCPSSHFTVFEQAQSIAMRYQRMEDLEIEKIHDFPLSISEKYLMLVVEELVDNAFKFSMPGSKVVIKTALLDSHLKISVCNSGRKMTADQINDIGAFVQFNRDKYEQQGSGLGLAIVKRIAELFKGKFDITCTESGETIASVTFRVLDMEDLEY